ncbi:unnamed protein product [Periconia digitata]|uniref:Uncharacterized protein n=1 Tax=Periconia digitata TaxID=1303443 RepID=A0A9W4USD4_9PLEO|nr:unnamed protein product [Periconia digitata]
MRFFPATMAQLDFAKHGTKIFNRAKKQFPGQPFRMITNVGDTLVLPPRFANLIQNNKTLNFSQTVVRDFHAHVPGFQPLGLIDHQGQILQNIIKKRLVTLLHTITRPVESETAFAVHLIFGDTSEWKEAGIQDASLDLIARVACRAFLGEELCRNKEWLVITKNYTRDGFRAAQQLSTMPERFKFLLPIFSRKCRVVRDQARRAQEIIKSVIENRRRAKEQAHKKNDPQSVPEFNDAMMRLSGESWTVRV